MFHIKVAKSNTSNGNTHLILSAYERAFKVNFG